MGCLIAPTQFAHGLPARAASETYSAKGFELAAKTAVAAKLTRVINTVRSPTTEGEWAVNKAATSQLLTLLHCGAVAHHREGGKLDGSIACMQAIYSRVADKLDISKTQFERVLHPVPPAYSELPRDKETMVSSGGPKVPGYTPRPAGGERTTGMGHMTSPVYELTPAPGETTLSRVSRPQGGASSGPLGGLVALVRHHLHR
jgi:hypothetical protein